MKNFVTRVSVGEFVGEGEGKSKKISKKNAARAVLEQLRRLPPLPAVERVKPRIKKKSQPTCKVRAFPRKPTGKERAGCCCGWGRSCLLSTTRDRMDVYRQHIGAIG
jgi:hypothetical protein